MTNRCRELLRQEVVELDGRIESNRKFLNEKINRQTEREQVLEQTLTDISGMKEDLSSLSFSPESSALITKRISRLERNTQELRDIIKEGSKNIGEEQTQLDELSLTRARLMKDLNVL